MKLFSTLTNSILKGYSYCLSKMTSTVSLNLNLLEQMTQEVYQLNLIGCLHGLLSYSVFKQ